MPPLGSLTKQEEVLDKIRGRLYTTIERNQGATYTELLARMDYFEFVEMSRSSLRGHLDMLEEKDYIKSVWNGKRNFYYTADFKIPSKPILTRVEEIFISAISENPGSSGEELAETLGRAPSTVSYYVKRLVGLGLARIERRGKRAEVYKVENES